MGRTVDNLLTLAQVDEGRLELLTRKVDLRELVDAAATRLLALAAVKDVRIAVNGAARPVTADPQRLQQALTNLIENAIKYSPAGGAIDVRVWREGDRGCLSVADRGIGIPASDLPDVFDRFHRGANVDDRQFAGMGLGLYICRAIVEAHGGEIAVVSPSGPGGAGGTTFTVRLPLTQPEAVSTTPAAHAAASA